MSINLAKGQRVDLTKENPELTKLLIGLGWDTNKYNGSKHFDLDATAFLLGDNDKVTNEKDFIFYGNLKHESEAVESMGDNLTGEGDGDDEQLKVDLANVPADIKKIVFAVTIHEAMERGQNFGQVSNSFIRVVDEVNDVELMRFDLGEDFSIETALVVAELYRHNGEWKFNAIGSGFQGGLAALCTNFGIEVA